MHAGEQGNMGWHAPPERRLLPSFGENQVLQLDIQVYKVVPFFSCRHQLVWER